MTEDTLSGGAVSGGAVSGGAVSGGAVSGGAVSGGAVSGGAVSGGPLVGSAFVGGSVGDGVVADGSMGDGVVADGSVAASVGWGGLVPGAGTAGDGGPGSALAAALVGYRPRNAAEAADLERAQALLADGDPWPRSTAVHATCSAMIVHPPTGRVLLRWHARQQAWLQVGGHADPGEVDPLAVAVREGREETGLTDLRPWPDARVLHLVVVRAAASATEPEHEHVDVRFVLATDTPESARPEKPDAPLRWLSIMDARALSSKPNLHETLDRVSLLLDEWGPGK